MSMSLHCIVIFKSLELIFFRKDIYKMGFILWKQVNYLPRMSRAVPYLIRQMLTFLDVYLEHAMSCLLARLLGLSSPSILFGPLNNLCTSTQTHARMLNKIARGITISFHNFPQPLSFACSAVAFSAFQLPAQAWNLSSYIPPRPYILDLVRDFYSSFSLWHSVTFIASGLQSLAPPSQS